MNQISVVLSRIRSALALAIPDRIIATDLVDFPQRKVPELEKGIVTVLLLAADLHDWDGMLNMKLVGQISVPERTSTKHDIETAELEIFQQLRAFIRNPGPGIPRIQAHQVRFSSQMEFPWGWVSMDIDVGPIDLADGDDSEVYPPTVHIGDLKSVHVDIDVHDPLRSRDEHLKWLGGDTSSSKPDLSTQLELNNGTSNP